MTDIVSVGDDLAVFDTDTCRAKNILSVQIGNLEYEPEFGIDLRYFLSEEFSFQNESFKSYLVQRLASYRINVATLTQEMESLWAEYTFNLTPAEVNTSLIAR